MHSLEGATLNTHIVMHQTSVIDETGERSYDAVEVRRSFRLLSMDAIFYFCGLAFLDQSTVMPAFLSTLTESSLAIGAIMAIRPTALFLPQLWTAHYLRSRNRHMGFLLKVASVARVAIALFAVTLFLTGPQDRTLMLWGFVIMYAAFWLSEGGAGVPWTDLVAKTIPERLRGRLFGVMHFAGGILAVLAGLFASRILSPGGPDYPTNYAVLMAVSAFFFAMSLASLAAVREPEGQPEEHEGDFFQYAKTIGRIVSEHSRLKRLLIVQVLIGFWAMPLPFYILYAKETAGIGGEMVGIFLSIQMAGGIVSSAIAGYVSDHYGPKAVIMSTILAGILAPALALVIGGASVWIYAAVFFVVGWVIGSSWIGLTNFLLEMAAPRERRTFIGVMNTANAPTMLFPLLGGLIVQLASYQILFAVTALAFTAALILALGLMPKERADTAVA